MSEVFIHGFLAALVAGLVTGIGGLCVFIKKHYYKSEINLLLNIAAGVMLSASFFSLLMPSFDNIVGKGETLYIDALKYALAIGVGVLLVGILNVVLPHEHNGTGHHGPHFDIKKIWLFLIAITLHKIPEGLAVGIAYGAENIVNPLSLLIGIAIHNIPEGVSIVSSVYKNPSDKKTAIIYITIASLAEPLGALTAYLFL